CCEDMDGFRGARLGWCREPSWHAVLETDQPAGREGLVAALVARQKGRPTGRELNWASTLKTAPTEYLKAADEAREDLRQGRRAYADFLTSFACELGTDDSGQLEPTAFYMTSGQQQFLKEARNLARSVAEGVKNGRRKKTSEALFAEALF